MNKKSDASQNATKKDIHELRTEFRTDLQNTEKNIRDATKKDIHELRTELQNTEKNIQDATKKDIHELRDDLRSEFRNELKKYATKIDLRGVEKNLRADSLKLEVRLERVEESQSRTEVILNKISTQLDGFVGRVDDLSNDNEVGASQINELREVTNDHENRISKLESTT